MSQSCSAPSIFTHTGDNEQVHSILVQEEGTQENIMFLAEDNKMKNDGLFLKIIGRRKLGWIFCFVVVDRVCLVLRSTGSQACGSD